MNHPDQLREQLSVMWSHRYFLTAFSISLADTRLKKYVESYLRVSARVVLGAIFLAFLAPQAWAQNAKGTKAYNGKTIGTIDIVVQDVFRENEDGLVYEAANALKVNTKEDIVRRELLFQEGDVYDAFTVSESARNLRSLPFLRDIRMRETVRGDYVDMQIIVQDTWTFFPVLSVSSGTGTDSQSIGVVEGNLLGYGKRAEFLLAEDEGRRKYEAVWDDRRFLGTLQRMSLGHFERSDGRRSVISWGLPFRSLVNTQAWFVDVDSYDLIGRLFSESQERFIYRDEALSFFSGYTWSIGTPSDLINRFTLGYGYTRNRFSQATESDFADIGLDPRDLHPDGGELAQDRLFSGPSVSYQRIQPDFMSLNYVDNFDRPQDFNLGNEFVTNLHIAPAAFGSNMNALRMSVTDTDGYRINDSSFVRGQVSLQSRLEEDDFNNTIASLLGRFYRVYTPSYWGKVYLGQHTLASSISLRSGYDMDADREFLLGAGNSLRAYEDRTFTGMHAFSVNIEDRIHMVDDILKLVSLGGAVFADAGTVSRNQFGDLLTNPIYADVGVGLRLGLLRSSGGTVVRIDLAVPLKNGPDGSGAFEPRLLFTTGQLFSAFLRSDAPGLSTPSISANFNQ